MTLSCENQMLGSSCILTVNAASAQDLGRIVSPYQAGEVVWNTYE